MPITCALRKTEHLVARSAMSSPCPCAEGIIERCIAAAMKPRGGRKLALILLLRPVRFGSERILQRLTRISCLSSTLWQPNQRSVQTPSVIGGSAAAKKFASQNRVRSRSPMATLSQIEANRRNACRSTGPKTEAGKKRSCHNAVKHGLTAETVIAGLEDSQECMAFELSVTADFDAQTAVERELVLRLASLLWRLRRAAAIETGLLQIQSEILRES